MMAILKASLAFVKSLLGPRAPISAYSVNGHSVLVGWDRVPEEEMISQEKKEESSAKLALYSYQGPHAGELIFLGKPTGKIGRSMDSDITITPEKLRGK